MKVLFLVVFVLAVVAALLFVVRGEWLLSLMPVVKRFRQVHAVWGSLRLKAGLDPPRELKHVVQLRFEEVGAPEGRADWESVRNRRLGDVVTLVHFKERDLRQLTREMRSYCAVFLILLCTGVLLSIDQFVGKTPVEIADALLSHHTIPVLEVVAIIYLGIRLVAETRAISVLLED